MTDRHSRREFMGLTAIGVAGILAPPSHAGVRAVSAPRTLQNAPSADTDLVVINGDPSRTINDVRKVEIVFRQGIGYDPAKLIESVNGRVGLF